MLDIFDPDSGAYTTLELTLAINKLPVNPGRIGRMNLFRRKGITTEVAAIEEKHGRLGLVATAARGTMPNVKSGSKRELRYFKCPHIPLNRTVMADEVQGVRAFGEEDANEVFNTKLNDAMEEMKQDMEATLEWHRAGAVSGKILDADGSTVIYDIYDEFGLTETEKVIGTNQDMKAWTRDLARSIEDSLGQTPYQKIGVLCGDEMFDFILGQESIAHAFAVGMENEFFKTQQAAIGGNDQGFDFGGVTFFNYRGKVGSQFFIPTDEGRAFPIGCPDMFIEYNAPAPFMETVNTIGKPFYAKQKLLDWDMGVELHTQTNTLYMPTRPAALRKIVID
jgi:hypothetical protein